MRVNRNYPQQTRPPELVHDPLPICTVAPGRTSVALRFVMSLNEQSRRPLPHTPERHLYDFKQLPRRTHDHDSVSTVA